MTRLPNREAPVVSRSAVVTAMEDLCTYGVDARPAFATDRTEAGNRILRDIFSEHPHAVGSWAAWIEPDDCAFEDGVLKAPLTIHCSAEDVVRANAGEVLLAMDRRIVQLEARVEGLERQLSRNSGNSSAPPSQIHRGVLWGVARIVWVVSLAGSLGMRVMALVAWGVRG